MTWNTLSKTFIESSMPSEQSLRLEVGGIKGCRPPQDLTKFGNRTPGGGERFRSGLRAVGSGQHQPRRPGVSLHHLALRRKEIACDHHDSSDIEDCRSVR